MTIEMRFRSITLRFDKQLRLVPTNMLIASFVWMHFFQGSTRYCEASGLPQHHMFRAPTRTPGDEMQLRALYYVMHRGIFPIGIPVPARTEG